MVKTVTLFICLFIPGCGSPAINSNAASIAAASPSPTPTVTNEERKVAEDDLAAEKDKAIQTFISREFNGWTMEGLGTEFGECGAGDICDLHLVSGARTKVVPVILRQFTKPDGTTYWLVFEARQIDLLKSRVEAMVQRGEDAVLENLTFDNCENICADEWEAARERMDYLSDDDLVPADPRWGG